MAADAAVFHTKSGFNAAFLYEKRFLRRKLRDCVLDISFAKSVLFCEKLCHEKVEILKGISMNKNKLVSVGEEYEKYRFLFVMHKSLLAENGKLCAM